MLYGSSRWCGYKFLRQNTDITEDSFIICKQTSIIGIADKV
jgi:hypothetical protein